MQRKLTPGAVRFPSGTARRGTVRYREAMAPELDMDRVFSVTCPHCHRPAEVALLAGGKSVQRGFKCPHCRLFVPVERADADAPPTRSGDTV